MAEITKKNQKKFNVICWANDLINLLNLTSYQLEFFGRTNIPRNDHTKARKRSGKFEKYLQFGHMPGPKTLERFRGTKGEKAEYWLNHSIWCYLGDELVTYDQISNTLNQFRREGFSLNANALKTGFINFKAISRLGPIEVLWRKGSLEAVEALLALKLLGKKHNNQDLEFASAQAAYNLLVLLSSNQPLYSIREELFDFLHETTFKGIPLCKELVTQSSQINYLHQQLEETFLTLRSQNIPLLNMNKKATAIYRLWQYGAMENGLSNFHMLSRSSQQQFYHFYYGHCRKNIVRKNFGLRSYRPYGFNLSI